MTTIYHNPRCSKSRAALGLLRERGVEAEVVEYLATPPTVDELEVLAGLLGCGMRDIIRSGETEYRELDVANAALTEAALRELVAAHPKLLQRPIVVHGGKAVVGRPPGKVLEIL